MRDGRHLSADTLPVVENLTLWVVDPSSLLTPSVVTFKVAKHQTFTVQLGLPAGLVTISGLPKWVETAPGAGDNTLVVSGKAPANSAGLSYNAIVTVTGLAPPAPPPLFTVSVGTA